MVASTIYLVDQNEMLLREQRLKSVLNDVSGSYTVCLIECSPVPPTPISPLRRAAWSSSP